MKFGDMTLEEARKHLIKKGWKWNKDAGHAWQYSLPPYPAQYKLEDALSLQASFDKRRSKLPKSN